MNSLHNIRAILLIILISIAVASCSSYAARSASRKVERQMAGSGRAFRESRRTRMAKKQQEKRQARIKKDYSNHVRASRKRSYEIQSPEVKARMKRNEANVTAREKAKARKSRSQSKKTGKKYR